LHDFLTPSSQAVTALLAAQPENSGYVVQVLFSHELVGSLFQADNRVKAALAHAGENVFSW